MTFSHLDPETTYYIDYGLTNPYIDRYFNACPYPIDATTNAMSHSIELESASYSTLTFKFNNCIGDAKIKSHLLKTDWEFYSVTGDEFTITGLTPGRKYDVESILTLESGEELKATISASTLDLYHKVTVIDKSYTSLTFKVEIHLDDNLIEKRQVLVNDVEVPVTGDVLTVNGLTPHKYYDVYSVITLKSGEVLKAYATTYTLEPSITVKQSSLSATSITAECQVKCGEAKVSEIRWYLNYYYNENYIGSGNTIHISKLLPRRTYDLWAVVTIDDVNTSKKAQLSTMQVTMVTLPSQPMNNTTALLCAETNIDDDEENLGFEWRRYDAPSTFPSNKEICPSIDGKIMGALSGLNPEVYYNYRPFFIDSNGVAYYGEWITFFTGDANVFFDPTVRTYKAELLDNFSAVLKGYALRGSENIAKQGFEYWSDWGTPSRTDSNVTEIEVKGQKISCTVSNLSPATTYYYRTFVETETGRTYGDTMWFTTAESDGFVDIKYSTDKSVEIEGYYDLQGRRYDEPLRGFTIIRYTDGTTKKVLTR